MKNFQITDVKHTAHIWSLHTTSGSEILIYKKHGASGSYVFHSDGHF